MAGRSLIVLTLLLALLPGLGAGGSSVHAEVGRSTRVGKAEAKTADQLRVVRRPVAVVDLSNDHTVRDVANRLLDMLASHTELAPPAISDAAALVDRPPADDERWLLAANKKRDAAELNLAQRNFREAALDAVEGQEILLHVTPRAALTLYADLALALGQSRLGEKRDAEAREAFALTHRLDPRRTLDDLHYLPEVVRTFDAANKENPGMGTIMVRGAGDVWIDGEQVGKAPGEFRVPLGRHVVWLTGFNRETAGKEVLVTASRPGDATIMDGALTRPQRVLRYRLALMQAHVQDATKRAVAMKALAEFVNVHDAVLLWSDSGRLVWQTWRDRAPGFSPPRELGSASPLEILKQLAPPPPVVEPEPPAVAEPIIEARWYERRPVQAGLVASVLVMVVTGVLWARYTEPARPWNPVITTIQPSRER
jgi:hypothetical protein